MSKYKVLTDGNGSDLIQVVGLGIYVPLSKFRDIEVERDALAANMAEHQRLHRELNTILHPDGNGPSAPSLCDLVSYVRSDRQALAAQVEVLNTAAKYILNTKKPTEKRRAYAALADAVNKTPQQHLRELRAKAIEEALDYMYSNTSSGNSAGDDFDLIREYANSIRQDE